MTRRLYSPKRAWYQASTPRINDTASDIRMLAALLMALMIITIVMVFVLKFFGLNRKNQQSSTTADRRNINLPTCTN